MPKTVYLYLRSKEKIDFKKIENFLKDNFGFSAKLTVLKEDIVQTKGLLFELLKTQEYFGKLKPRQDAINIVVTDKLIATYEDSDKRLHLRAGIFGYPSVISTSGIVEAPAKPKGYYLFKQRYSSLKIWELKEQEIKQKFKDRFIDYGDRRLSDILKGYISQAIFFHLCGEPFCENKACRLFNAHWQEDLIKAQLKSAKFCLRHRQELKRIKKGSSPE